MILQTSSVRRSLNFSVTKAETASKRWSQTISSRLFLRCLDSWRGVIGLSLGVKARTFFANYIKELLGARSESRVSGQMIDPVTGSLVGGLPVADLERWPDRWVNRVPARIFDRAFPVALEMVH